ncbi:transcriptional regulator [Micromonospora acroterricola]|uniref:Transcriptional regulator n=1 Tax=Micromonospora acroterricola TaxID=2202421 RepID=A0A317D8D3_9ACTN|nr:metalloregulator ArsR/SmtB family transcription factor [Micromonospora acroterricola]PWR09043.1 transcriptional regulator [Micromonospora acroterricola]
MTVDTNETQLAALRAVADPLRWRVMQALAREQLCVCHLVEDLGVTQPLISHHLRALRQAGLVETERHRYWTYYRLRPEAVRALGQGIAALADHAPTGAEGRRPCGPDAPTEKPTEEPGT